MNRFISALGVLLLVLAANLHGEELEVVYPEVAYKGKTYKNVRVVSDNPVDLFVAFQGGMTRIPRSEAPEVLRKHYPYDAGKAEAHAKERQAKGAQSAAQHQQEMKTEVNRKVAALARAEQQAQAQLKGLQEVLEVQNRTARGKRKSPARAEADRLREQKKGLLVQLQRIQSDLAFYRSVQTSQQ